ncbi:hypothetical protein NDU88_006050 [Pleurodeles waltl]|uniref:Uncharacterized protein n=1 Tax=Pleurodeles waltl TaxID=8319 RepID=A0AAV7WBB9_PLEWA|nr:hypothetical protein NDU88_006050 [Pleurodeles waltl]
MPWKESARRHGKTPRERRRRAAVSALLFSLPARKSWEFGCRGKTLRERPRERQSYRAGRAVVQQSVLLSPQPANSPQRQRL